MSNEGKILVIDIETTHVDYRLGSIVEVGISEVDITEMNVKLLFSSVCREDRLTAKHRTSPYGWIFENSDLTVDDVRNAPKFEDVVIKIQKIINDYPLGVTAFNRRFDITYLSDRGIKFGKLQPCPMLTLAPVMNLPNKNGRGTGKWPSVTEVYKLYMGYPNYEECHRAASDSFDEGGIILHAIERGDYKVEF